MAKIINMILGGGMNSIMNLVNESITVKLYTISRDSNDDTTKTYSSSTVARAYLEPVTEGYSDERFGEVRVGDIVCYFNKEVSITDKERTEITAHGSTWKVVDTLEWKPNSQLVYTMCLLRKFDSRS